MKSKEYTAFVKLTDRLLSVSRVELQKRLDSHRENAAQNPNKRGPKPKRAQSRLPLPAAP
jgi:hypothetical protein